MSLPGRTALRGTPLRCWCVFFLAVLLAHPASAASTLVGAFATRFADLKAGNLLLADVPTQPCATGGQADEPLPKLPRSVRVRVPKAAAGRLTFYRAAAKQGLFGPPGWTCRATEGSDGFFLVIAPAGAELGPEAALAGPALVLHRYEGGTSGRFEVAAIGARVFPVLRTFAEGVKAEGIESAPIGFAPWPGDRLERLSDRALIYATPANRAGLGAQRPMVPGASAIEGFATVAGPLSSPELTILSARLSPAERDLFSIIALLAFADSAP